MHASSGAETTAAKCPSAEMSDGSAKSVSTVEDAGMCAFNSRRKSMCNTGLGKCACVRTRRDYVCLKIGVCTDMPFGRDNTLPIFVAQVTTTKAYNAFDQKTQKSKADPSVRTCSAQRRKSEFTKPGAPVIGA